MTAKLINYVDYKKENRVKREPLYELHEIADKLKIDEKNIRAKMLANSFKDFFLPPKPAMKRTSFVGNRPNLYKLSEFKQWLKKLNEFNNEDAPL
jgi:hypothetical protein